MWNKAHTILHMECEKRDIPYMFKMEFEQGSLILECSATMSSGILHFRREKEPTLVPSQVHYPLF